MIPVRIEMVPHTIMHAGRYKDGFPMWLSNIFLIRDISEEQEGADTSSLRGYLHEDVTDIQDG